MLGLRTSLISRTSAEPYSSYAIAFMPSSSYGARVRSVYAVHLSRTSLGVRRTLVKRKHGLQRIARGKGGPVGSADQGSAPAPPDQGSFIGRCCCPCGQGWDRGGQHAQAG